MIICIDYGYTFCSYKCNEYKVSAEHAHIIEELCKTWEKEDNEEEIQDTYF